MTTQQPNGTRQDGTGQRYHVLVKKLTRRFEKAAKFRSKRYDLFVRCIKPRKGETILDVGSDTGEFLETFVGRDYNVIALDINPKALIKLKEKYPHIETVQGDATQLPFPDKSFDIVISNSVIEHLSHPEKTAKMASEIRRVAKRYFVQTPYKYFPIDPHFLLPYFSMWPHKIKLFLSDRFPVGHYKRGGIRHDNPILLSARQFAALFPDATIIKEKCLFLTKSLIAVKE